MSQSTSTETAAKLKELAELIYEELKQGQNPYVDIPSRTLSNVMFDPVERLIKLKNRKIRRSYFNAGQAKRFMQTVLVIDAHHNLLTEGQRELSIRQIYYTLKRTIDDGSGSKKLENTFDEQGETDTLIEDIEVAIDVLREDLNVIATPTGVITGNMIVTSIDKDGEEFRKDLTQQGTEGASVPANVRPDTYLLENNGAEFILVIEKFAVFNLLSQDKFWKSNNCILLTGKGQPSRAERRLLRRMVNEFEIPAYVFTDMDPWGYYIYSVYKQGSINLAHFSHKAGVPDARYIGLETRDIDNFDIPATSFIDLNDKDRTRIKELQHYDWFKSEPWQDELGRMLDRGIKVEQDALVAKNLAFTSKQYLPEKIKQVADAVADGRPTL